MKVELVHFPEMLILSISLCGVMTQEKVYIFQVLCLAEE
jgi:hypothetical protein